MHPKELWVLRPGGNRATARHAGSQGETHGTKAGRLGWRKYCVMGLRGRGKRRRCAEHGREVCYPKVGAPRQVANGGRHACWVACCPAMPAASTKPHVREASIGNSGPTFIQGLGLPLHTRVLSFDWSGSLSAGEKTGSSAICINLTSKCKELKQYLHTLVSKA